MAPKPFMRSFFFLSCIVVACLHLGACSPKVANTPDNTANVNATAPPAQFTDADAALAEGSRLLDENQIEPAIEALKQAVALNPELAEAHFKLGVAYSLREMQMEQSGDQVPTEGDANGKKPAKLLSEKAFEKAVEAYQKWLKTNPNDDAAHFYLGRTYSKLLKDEEALDEFKQAVKLKPDDTEYQTELGAVLIKLAQYRDAVAPLKKAIDLDPTNDRAAALLEDAEAGRQRIDYVSKNSNANVASNKSSNSNSNSVSNSNSNSAGKPPDANFSRLPTNARPGPPREVPRSRIAAPTPKRPS